MENTLDQTSNNSTTSSSGSRSQNTKSARKHVGTGNAKDTNQTKTPKNTSPKLRGLPKDTPEVRLSKTLSWLLRHGAQGEGLPMRADGYVKVLDLLENPKIKSQSLDLDRLQEIVNADAKKRYELILDPDSVWWIKANQGHSIKTVKLDLKPILSLDDIPSRVAVHGTNKKAWQLISSQGLSKMKRNHVHLAQGVSGDNVISGMRKSCDILIFIDIPKALSSGIKFYLSENGVVLTEGDSTGFLRPQFFKRVEDAKRTPLPGWEGIDDTLGGDVSIPSPDPGVPVFDAQAQASKSTSQASESPVL